MKRGLIIFICVDLFAGVCVALYMWFQLGAAPPSFDYAAASKAERTEWLTAHARVFAEDVAAGLPKAEDGSITMAVADTSVNAARRQIEVIVQLSSRMQMTDDLITMKRDLIAKRCPVYAASELGRNEVYVFETYRHGLDDPALTLGVTPIVCRDYL